MVFNMAVAIIMFEVKQAMERLQLTVVVKKRRCAFALDPDPAPIAGPVWVDDQAMVVEAGTPEEAVEGLALLTQAVVDIARRRGLQVNVQAGTYDVVAHRRSRQACVGKASKHTSESGRASTSGLCGATSTWARARPESQMRRGGEASGRLRLQQ